MRGFARHAILVAVAFAIGGLLLLKHAAAGPEGRATSPVRAAADGVRGETLAALPSGRPSPEEAPPVEAILTQALRGDFPRGLPAEVLSGPVAVQGPGEDARALGELALTESQATVVQALWAERDARLAELRGEIADRPQEPAAADRLSARAEGAQAAFLASIRSTLLPDQRSRFESLLSTGRWGGYTLAIPLRR